MSARTQYIAGGTILPCRFIMQSTSAPFTAIQATANAPVCGIAFEGSTIVPIKGYTDGLVGNAATVGLPVTYYSEHDECLVVAGGQIAVGDYLVSDANGCAVKATGSGKNIGAVALEAASASGVKIRVRVEYQRDAVPSA